MPAQSAQRSVTLTVGAAPGRVWVVDDLTRIRPTDPAGAVTTATLKGARNETVACQVGLRGPLSAVTFTVSDLVGPGTIPKSNVRLFREAYITITTPSAGISTPAGPWPDGLIPWTPTTVASGQNQPVWVDVTIPKGTPPGTYTGTLTASSGDVVPITLTVWAITLPDIPSLRTDFGTFGHLDSYYGGLGSGYQAVENTFLDFMLAHRIQNTGPTNTLPSRAADGTPTFSAAATAAFAAWFTKANTYRIAFDRTWPYPNALTTDRTKATNYLRGTAAYLRAHGWLGASYIYAVDEPNTAADYQAVRDWAALIHAADPALNVLVTEQPTPENAAWGSLVGAVNTWVTLFDFYDGDAAIPTRLAAGDTVWAYTALSQGAARGIPVWLLDTPLVNYRVAPWLCWRFRATGLLYWTVMRWYAVTDPWADPRTYISSAGWNGEGNLIYPGDPWGIPHTPLPSIRLKALRAGLYDYDYLAQAAALGDTTIAALLTTLMPSWVSWPTNLAALRETVAARIVAFGGT